LQPCDPILSPFISVYVPAAPLIDPRRSQSNNVLLTSFFFQREACPRLRFRRTNQQRIISEMKDRRASIPVNRHPFRFAMLISRHVRVRI